MKHVIIIERRRPTKAERTTYGTTHTSGDITTIFLSEQQSDQEMINTLFHEFAHAYHHIFNVRVDDKEDERIARLVGNVAEPCFRKYKRGLTSKFRPTGKHK